MKNLIGKNESGIAVDYREFTRSNRVRINRYLNAVLCLFIIAGPAIAFGIRRGYFQDISYRSCVIVTIVVFALVAVHMLMIKRMPNSAVPGLFVLTALDALLLFMAYSGITIHITWFLVPFLSILFCERFIYLYAVIVNYIFMVAATWVTAPYYDAVRTNISTPEQYFAGALGGLTIETLVMFAVGYLICIVSVGYFRRLLEQHNEIRHHAIGIKEKMDILYSMAEIYDNVNLIDFVESTEMSLRDGEQKKIFIDMEKQTHTAMNQRIKNSVMPDQLGEFLRFTDITTVRSRLKNRKVISSDFLSMDAGWFRAQYITVDSAEDGTPDVVIYTTRNVDDEKRREEYLLRISMTDELTRLFNRRRYEEDLDKLRNSEIPDDFVLFSIDLNGLKRVNDNKGHKAGDEFIKGAAELMMHAMRDVGNVYRVGGDEFLALTYTANPEAVKKDMQNRAKEWRGVYTDNMSLAIGYAAFKDHGDATADDLERIADARMYEEKEKYYLENNIDRRKS